MQKIRLTRPELKKQRDALRRFRHYLPMLKLKQQQLQLMIRQVRQKQAEASDALESARLAFEPVRPALGDFAGLNVTELAKPQNVRRRMLNIAGVALPTVGEIVFPKAVYSLFATPAWVDRALADLRQINRRQAELEVVTLQLEILQYELARVIQRVNLFEKVKIPQAREAIRQIRIRLGDEMTAAVGRAKMAKARILADEPLLATLQEDYTDGRQS